jgi:hypothetical protein
VAEPGDYAGRSVGLPSATMAVPAMNSVMLPPQTDDHPGRGNTRGPLAAKVCEQSGTSSGSLRKFLK